MRWKVLLILFFACHNIYSQTDSLVHLETEDSIILHGSINIPSSAKHIALFISGSGPTDRNGNNKLMTNNSLKMLSEALSINGIATLRYDKRGVAKSEVIDLDESKLRFETYINDALKWVQFINSNHPDLEVTIIGHSEGSTIAMIVANKIRIQNIISIAGPGLPANEIFKNQLKAQPPMILELALPIIDSLEKGHQVIEIHPILQSAFRQSVQPYLVSWFAYDPCREIKNLSIPILIIQGKTDIQVGLEDAELLLASNKSAELLIIDSMNHVLKNAPLKRVENIKTYNNPELPLSYGLVDGIVNFILKK